MVYTRLEPSPQELEDYYADYPAPDEIPATTIKRYDELLDRFERYRHTGRLIDVGCGAGHFLQRAALRGWEVHGTEFGQRPVAVCRARGISIIEGPLDVANYRPDHFDVICSLEVIEHLVHPVAELQRMHTILRPGGLVYITTPNYRSVGHWISGSEWSIVQYPEHLCYFTSRTLSRTAASAGFRQRWLLTTGVSLVRLWTKRSKDQTIRDAAVAGQEKLRSRMETAWHLKVAKKLADALLNLLRIGDSIKAGFEKPAQ